MYPQWALPPPTEVFVDQIRVTPFFWEWIARQIERYWMSEVYAFLTDFPRAEGGHRPQMCSRRE